MQNKSLETLSVSANGVYTFTKSSYTYSFGLKTYLLGKNCTISNRLVTALANVANIDVSCINLSYTTGGSALGLISTEQTTAYVTAFPNTDSRNYWSSTSCAPS